MHPLLADIVLGPMTFGVGFLGLALGFVVRHLYSVLVPPAGGTMLPMNFGPLATQPNVEADQLRDHASTLAMDAHKHGLAFLVPIFQKLQDNDTKGVVGEVAHLGRLMADGASWGALMRDFVISQLRAWMADPVHRAQILAMIGQWLGIDLVKKVSEAHLETAPPVVGSPLAAFASAGTASRGVGPLAAILVALCVFGAAGVARAEMPRPEYFFKTYEPVTVSVPLYRDGRGGYTQEAPQYYRASDGRLYRYYPSTMPYRPNTSTYPQPTSWETNPSGMESYTGTDSPGGWRGTGFFGRVASAPFRWWKNRPRLFRRC